MTTPAAPASPTATATKKPKRIDFTPGRRAIQQQHLDLRLDGVLNERYSLVVLPPTSDLATASWTYLQPKGEPARHVITFGPKLAENQQTGDLGDYAASYHRHELAHSLWTERDLKSLSERCDAEKIPFGALNVFEDARIEHLWREKFEVPFGWEAYEGPKGDPVATDPVDKRALAGLMAIIQNEGQVGLLEGRLKDLPEAAEVMDFYDRMIAVEDTSELFPLLNEWKTKYGFPPDMDEGSSKATGGDMKAGAKIQSDAKEAGKLAKAEKEGSEDDPAGMGVLSSVVPTGQAKGLVLHEHSQPMDEFRIKALADILRNAFNERERKISRATPAKRLNIRNFVLEREKIFRTKEKTAPGAVDMAVIFDCSGSMRGVPNDAGRHLVAALGQLAREGRVRGDLILTIGLKGDAINQTMPLSKVDSTVASHISANGEFEGFNAAMKANIGKIKGRSLVIGYTDGHITDSEIDRKVWHQLGVYSIGCYVGKPESAENLGKWFDAPLCRSTETGLALALRDMVAVRARQSKVVIPTMATAMAREVEEEAPAAGRGRRMSAGV